MHNRNFNLIFIIILITFFIYSQNIYCDDITSKIDEVCSKYQELGIISGVVLLAKDSNTVYEKSFGYADYNNNTPNTKSTHFNIASITKVFTREMILQLKDEGKLLLNDPLSKYLDLYPKEIGSKITIQMLIDMKAGLGDYIQDPAFNINPARFSSVNELLDVIKDELLLFEPGTSEQYSNSGYVVLGGIIEKVTGKTYKENLQERIFTPAQMNSTYFEWEKDAVPNAAIGTIISFSGNKKSLNSFISPSPAGGIYTNAEDLLKFDNMKKKRSSKDQNIFAGGTPEWNSILGNYENGYTLIILSNFGRIAEEIEMRVNDILHSKSYTEPGLPLEMNFYKIIKEKGLEYFKNNYKSLLEEKDLRFRDVHLNMFGYHLMEEGELDMALDVFKLNAELFPEIPNVYDSLGEAYMKKADKVNAKKNYQKVLDLQPGNPNAKKMLEELNN
jgi:CubicO group peptidase (beta-lactamase class C family)